MNTYTEVNRDGYEKVVRCDNPEIGFVAWIAVHNSCRGPALGGCRVWHYANEKEALTDVLRLSKGMTYKNSLAKLPLGGGKSVVHTDLKTINREALFEHIGLFVESLGGLYITAEDVNSTVEDMAIAKRKTSHVATVGSSGNPSPFTAYGVYCAIKAAVKHKLRKQRLDGLTVAIQGVGETGGRLAQLLKNDNCRIIAADINEDNIKSLEKKIALTRVNEEQIYEMQCDVFSPCALGGTLNELTIPRLNCSIVAGSANNQLLKESDGDLLLRRNILYVPDYAGNAGGVINISCELDQKYSQTKAMRLTAGIEQTVLEIIQQADKQGLPTNTVANKIAENLFKNVKLAA
jgi:leucine dehydrogenase